jgi:ABC-type sugar transport system ATPase subunit
MQQLTDAREGMDIIMISSYLTEIPGLADHLVVLYEGNLAAMLTAAETTQEKILTHAAGGATSNKGDTRMSDQKPTQVRKQP